jgi:hypothetical protein
MVRNGYLTAGEASEVLTKPLPLTHGRTLPASPNVDLSPGPTFTWWQLALGAIIVLGALAALRLLRARRFARVHGRLTAQLASIVLVILGAAVIIRSFRNA